MRSQPNNGESSPSYVLITAARNEARHISETIASVLAQSVPPAGWIIVSDGSTDGTDVIVLQAAREHSFIQLLRSSNESGRSFGSKVHALNAGYLQVENLEYGFIGILDADISLESDYYERALQKFSENPALGIAGGFIYEKDRGEFRPRRGNLARSTPGATQFFRRECFEAIGKMLPLKYGGEDWCAEVITRMNGWGVEAFPDLKVFHHRATGTADHLLRHRFREGRMDFSVGSHPLFEVAKLLTRLTSQPFVLGAFARFAGFLLAFIRQDPKPVSRAFITFLHAEQRDRLWSALRHPFGAHEQAIVLRPSPADRPPA